MRRVPGLLALVAVLVGVSAAPVTAAGTIRMVDDDGRARSGDCDGVRAVSKRIQPVIRDSAPGDIVLVCPGSYRELLTVGSAKDRVVIRSATLHGAIVRLPAGVSNTVPAMLQIAAGATEVRIEGMSFRRFTSVIESETSCAVDAAIRVRGTLAVIQAVNIQGAGPGSIGPCALHAGVVVGGDAAASATVRGSIIKDVDHRGIQAIGPGATLTARNNTIRFHHLSVVLTDSISRGSGIEFEDGAGGAALGNLVESHPTAGPLVLADNVHVTFGIRVRAADLPITVRRNTIHRAYNAIGVIDDVGAVSPVSALIRGNTTSASYNGVFVDGGDPRVVENTNTANKYGVYVRNPTAGAQFTDNVSSASAQTDCVDTTFGGGTAGTANTWSGNTGATAQPAAICD